MNTGKPIVVEDLREAGEDGGDLMGFYCRGHVDRHLFAIAANDHSGATSSFDRRWVDAKKCRHVWYRTVQVEGASRGTVWFKPAEPHAKGAWPATICDCVTEFFFGQTRQLIREHDRGYSNGMMAGVNWALRFLESRDSRLHDAMLKAYRERRDDLEAAPE